MKIQYKFSSETIEIEVSDEWSEILIDLDRQEYNKMTARASSGCWMTAGLGR